MKKMMEGVVLDGTARRAMLNGYTVAGKTGTAQKVDPATGGYSKTKYVASFVGFSPVNTPAITIAVMGCRVNGPGETDDADLGLWCAPNFVNLKRGGQELGAFPYDEILPRLKSELDALIARRAEPART